jgi:hypothetical protein
MIKEKKPTGFSEINLKIFWKKSECPNFTFGNMNFLLGAILLNHSLFTINNSLHMILLRTSTAS